jgi:hypothetical protein
MSKDVKYIKRAMKALEPIVNLSPSYGSTVGAGATVLDFLSDMILEQAKYRFKNDFVS